MMVGIFIAPVDENLSKTISAMDKHTREWEMRAARGECAWVCASCCSTFPAGMPDACEHGDQGCTDIIKRDKATAQLAEIEKVEPVAKLKPCREGWFIDLDNPPPLTGETIELFTRSMPAQDVDAGMINLPEPVAWFANYGGNIYTEAQLKQAVRDALDAELVKDAERYRWLRDYLISPSTHFDDLIVSADKTDTLDGVIDAAIAKDSKQ